VSINETRLAELFRDAPRSLRDLLELLREGLDWPIPDEYAAEPDDLMLDWTADELHLDPVHVARLAAISQLPRLTTSQHFGAFFLRFVGGQLPIGAVRRLVHRLVVSKRGGAGAKTPTWKLDDLVFFCLADAEGDNDGENLIHLVVFREHEGKRVLRVISWGRNPNAPRLNLLMRRAAPELTWSGGGPRLVGDHAAVTAFVGYREGIRSAKALSRRMAEVAQDVRDEVKALLVVETDAGPMRSLYRDVRERLIGDISQARFADVYAQTMVYGLLTARIAHPEQFKAERSLAGIKFDNEFLDAIYARFRDEADGVVDVDELGLADLAEMLAETNVDELLADFGADNERDDPVVYFYEEFLAQYDPQQRRDLGAFYTPKPVVRYIVKVVDDALKAFGLPLGVADPTSWGDYQRSRPDIEIPANVKVTDTVVSMFDPANGTGTFLVEWLEQARRNAGAAGLETALRQASALEISLASYAVSHLKVSLEMPDELREKERLPIYLGDTLGPLRVARLTGMDDPVGIEGVLANEVKYDRHHNVVIGNPPYDRVESAGTGGFITAPRSGTSRSLFDDIFDEAKTHTIFSHHASLYNLYVYFWRWAMWKALEENTGPAVVSMITASSWLTGPGFLGLRRLARELADEVVVLDLHGDNIGALKDENVFDIQSPVAIVTLLRHGKSDRGSPAKVSYASLRGTRSAKLALLSDLASGAAVLETQTVSGDWHAPFVPRAGGSEWGAFPALVDLFPFQIPGTKFNRTWPIAPLADLLDVRWKRLVATADATERATCFVTPPTGRGIWSKVGSLPRIVDLPVDSPAPTVARYGYRSFDRQYCFADARLAALERPALWASASEEQVYLATLATKQLGAGPALTASAYVPDLDYFSGRGGKDVIPLYRDAQGTPNADLQLLELVTARHRKRSPAATAVTVQKLFAYAFGLLAGTDYTARFADALETPGPRVPLTDDPALFELMAAYGERLIWLQTFGERFAAGQGELPLSGVAWEPEPSRLPVDRKDLAYDATTEELRVADGVLMGVPPEVYAFAVSGMSIIPKWLGYRTAKPPGRAASSASPLDKIRPKGWSPEWSQELVEIVAVLKDTLAGIPVGVVLLDRILDGPLISAADLPQPPAWMREPPKPRGEDESGLFSAADLK
jgi:hypothetical protein